MADPVVAASEDLISAVEDVVSALKQRRGFFTDLEWDLDKIQSPLEGVLMAEDPVEKRKEAKAILDQVGEFYKELKEIESEMATAMRDLRPLMNVLMKQIS
jgi:esterase/lipase